MFRLKSILFLILVFSFCTGIDAQDTIPELLKEKEQQKNYKHHVGMNLGTFSGSGFAYKFQPLKYGVQVVVIPPIGYESHSNIVLSGIYRIHNGQFYNLTAFASAGFGSFVFKPFIDEDVYNWFGETNGSLSYGAGFGLERNYKYINYTIMCSYGIVDLGYPIISLEFGLFYRLK